MFRTTLRTRALTAHEERLNSALTATHELIPKHREYNIKNYFYLFLDLYNYLQLHIKNLILMNIIINLILIFIKLRTIMYYN